MTDKHTKIVRNSHQRNINEHHKEISLPRMAKEQLVILSADENLEQLQLSHALLLGTQEYRQSGKQFGSVL